MYQTEQYTSYTVFSADIASQLSISTPSPDTIQYLLWSHKDPFYLLSYLINIFINDILSHPSTHLALFVDNTAIFAKHNNFLVLKNNLQKDINLIFKHFKSGYSKLTLPKHKQLSLPLKGNCAQHNYRWCKDTISWEGEIPRYLFWQHPHLGPTYGTHFKEISYG